MSSASTASGPETDDAPAVELRASVLDAAISLGFRNSVMAKWMFDPVAEAANDDDDDCDDGEATERSTPGLTSPSTSEESAMSPYNFRTPYPRQGNSNEQAFKAGPGSNDQFFVNPGPGVGNMPRLDEDDANRGGPVKLTLTVPVPPPNRDKERRNKLRKQKTGYGYESDNSGYVSEGGKKAKEKKSSRWRKREKERGKEAGDDYESDGGYLSEAIAITGDTKKKKTKTKRKEAKDKEKGERDASSPVGDPGALLATINASFLPGPGFEPGPGPGSEPGLGLGPGLDGYLTDSAGASEKRGRTKKKTKDKDKKTRTRPSSPAGGEEDASVPMPTKKKSLFRLITRSVSRDGKDRDKDRDRDRDRENETPPSPPPPVPPMPMPLPIAERFARAGSASPSQIVPPGPGLTKSSSSMELSSSGSTLVPPNDALRSESPWSYRSAPSRMGTAGTNEAWGGGGSLRVETAVSLDTPREEVGGMSPVVRSPEDSNDSSSSTSNINGNSNGEHSQHGLWRSLSRPTSPTSVSPGGLGRSQSRKIGRLFPFGHSSGNGNGETSKVSTAAISAPNPHLAQRESALLPNPFDIAAALTSRGISPTMVNPKNVFANSNSNGRRAESPESFIIIGEDEGIPTPVRQQAFEDTSTNANELSSSFLSPASTAYGSLGSPSSPTRPGLAARRAAPGRVPLSGLDVTPTQSRSGTPNPDEFMAARASVLAYYQVPPPSPPPTGPLPAPPQQPWSSPASPRSESDTLPPRRPSEDRQLLSPAHAFASRSPSPLGVGAWYSPARSPSPGMGQAGASVRRGRESPFPTRPVLPPQNSRELVERVERYKALYSAEGEEEQFEHEDGEEREDAAGTGREERVSMYASSGDFVDTRSSAYIRQARARGEKRVYFDVARTGEADAFPTDVSAVTPEIEVEAADGYFDDADDERLRYAKAGSDMGEGEGEGDRRSLASMSVYSRYSVLDADKSAQVRGGFVRRVAALYDQGQGQERDEIPDVPQVPAGLRDAGFAGRPEKGTLKITSSPYRF